MIYEHYISGGYVGFGTQHIERLGRKVPVLVVGIRDGGKMKTISVCLIHRNTEILPDLYKAIGHYLGHRESTPNDVYAYFQHETIINTGGEHS